MDITWYGHSCFRIAERNQTSVITDPYHESIGLPPLKVKGDVVTVSHNEPGHNAVDMVKGYQHVLTGPGEYEIGGVFVTGLAMHDVQNEVARWNVAFLVQYAGLNVLHLGDLAHVPDQSTIEEIGEVNVLLIPVGGGKGLKPNMAADVIALIEPHFIIPMHYELPNLAFQLEPVDKFLKAIGVSKVQEEETLRITPSNLPEQPQVVLLSPRSLGAGADER